MAKKSSAYISSEEYIALIKANKNPKIRKELTKLRETSREREIKMQVRGLRQKPAISSSLQNVGQVQQLQQKQQQKFQMLGSKAERIENYLTSINEVPFLQRMERERNKQTSPPDAWMLGVEKQTTDSFPD